jgi:hypothetical protein
MFLFEAVVVLPRVSIAAYALAEQLQHREKTLETNVFLRQWDGGFLFT